MTNDAIGRKKNIFHIILFLVFSKRNFKKKMKAIVDAMKFALEPVKNITRKEKPINDKVVKRKKKFLLLFKKTSAKQIESERKVAKSFVLKKKAVGVLRS